MTNPLTPPPELMAKLWREASAGRDDAPTGEIFNDGVRAAYQAGAEAQLGRFAQWLDNIDYHPHLRIRGSHLQAAMRPNPPSLKEQALDQYARIERILRYHGHVPANCVMEALKALPDE